MEYRINFFKSIEDGSFFVNNLQNSLVWYNYQGIDFFFEFLRSFIGGKFSFAISAIIGEAPVPVPPPSPQVKKTISTPDNSSLSFCRDSSAACLPISGSPPDPKPLVRFSPIWIFIVALLLRRAWASVLTDINSTPVIPPSAIIEARALPPPPPTPMTFIFAGCPTLGLINIL